MPLYREKPLDGSRVWTRCWQVVIDNPKDEPPRVTFQEERVFDVSAADEQVMRVPVQGCHADVDLEHGAFPLLDPETGEPTGASMSHAQLYVALYSLYFATALARDAGMNQG